ncbi:MAG: dienelactone hydrolase family protein [Acidimicrobiia bacterium]
MERAIDKRGLRYTAHDYPETGHWFAESTEANYKPDAAELALERTALFLGPPSPRCTKP